ncbi:hypothetical protein JBP901_gp074 [Bacillus phage JBP901]|uniref:Uncharacterized protein n=1 Tax=Bacillus phage JBP901 TaxID=1498212 RepID=A0A0E3DF33_9CAUD|nr:hypothetical protein JBP901_gp074 [Bacillus phage JBP901]AID17786.1 hypothetical protein JBP901_gp074 [Bacillus phage JBP901]
MGNVKFIVNNKVIAETESISAERVEVVNHIGATREEVKAEEKVSFVEACGLISKYLKDVHNVEMTGEQVFNLSPTGELFHVFYLYRQAKAFYDVIDKIRRAEEEDKQ